MRSSSTHSAHAQPPRTHRSPVVLSDLLGDLLWPRLLQTWKLALSPGRLLLCFILLVMLVGLDFIYATLSQDHRGPLTWLSTNVAADLRLILGSIFVAKNPAAAGPHVYDLFVVVPLTFAKNHWPALLTVIPLAIVLWSILGGAVCRSAACEIALRATLPWRNALIFSVRKAPAFIASFIGPLAIIWTIAAISAGLGYGLFAWKISTIIGSLLFGVFVFAGFVATVLMLGFLVGHFMLIPALACEGTDSFDAVQRTYAYVIARPGRLFIYAIILVFTIALAVSLAVLVSSTTLAFAQSASGTPITFDPGNGVFLHASDQFAVSTVFYKAWVYLALAVVLSYVLSLYFCASTTLYLIMRRLVDGQDIAELWTPTTPANPQPLTPNPDPADYT